MTIFLFFLVSVCLSACGGGGGGGGSSVDPLDSIPYTGSTTQAAITTGNAEGFAVNAFLGGGEGGSVAGIMAPEDYGSPLSMSPSESPRLVVLARGLGNSVSRIFRDSSHGAPAPRSVQTVSQTIYGTYGGNATYTITLDDATGTFNGTYAFSGFNDDNTVTLSGGMSFSGRVEMNTDPLVFDWMDISFNLLTLLSRSESSSLSGGISIRTNGFTETVTMNLHRRNDSSNKVYWLANYSVVSNPGTDNAGAFAETTISGRYYDPDHGYAVITTDAPIRTYLSNSWPSQGAFIVTGQGNNSARLTFLSANSYRVDADTDHDGLYDDWSSGIRHWSGMNASPVANAGLDQTEVRGSLVTMDGRGSSDADGDPLSYRWSVVSRPAGSVAGLSSLTAETPSFTPDVNGIFVFGLVVNDGSVDSPMDTITVNVQKAPVIPLRSLAWWVVDAEYSKALDRIVMISSGPNQLHIYDPVGGTDTAVNLPVTPNCVSVSPDGLHAAVGHNAWISYVNLSTGVLEKTVAVTTDVLDIVLAGNGFVYAFPRTDQWERIRCLNIATGAETLHTGNLIYAGTRGKLHPDGTAIYGAWSPGISPQNIEKYNIVAGTANYLYWSPYWGDYPIGGDLWIAEDGLRIFAKSGTVFRSSSIQSQDMTYNGTLSNAGSVQHLDHSSAAGKVLVIPGIPWGGNANLDTAVQTYSYTYLAYEANQTLPRFNVNGNTYAGHGRFVFFNRNGSNYFVILQADASSGMLYDFAVTGY